MGHGWRGFEWQGRKACDEFTHGGLLTETVLVGALADRFAGDWLEWDRLKSKFTNNAKANALFHRTYHDG